jgi:hypothetical protein
MSLTNEERKTLVAESREGSLIRWTNTKKWVDFCSKIENNLNFLTFGAFSWWFGKDLLLLQGILLTIHTYDARRT